MADQGIWIGTRPTTDEERAEIERGWRSGSAQQAQTSAVNAQPEETGYYSGPMGGAPAAEPVQADEPVEEPKPSTHWMANPENFAQVWSKYDQDPDYKDEHYSREQVDSLYDWYSYRNQGKTMDQWGPLMDNDEFVTGEIERNNWWDPVKEEQVREAQNTQTTGFEDYYQTEDPEKQALMNQREMGDWKNLDWIGKAFAAVTKTDQGLANMPSWTEKTQGAAQALSSAGAGAATLKIAAAAASLLGAGGAAAALANPIVLGAAALAVGGLTFYQSVSKKEIPIFNKFLEISDLADTITEHTLGFGAQAIDIGKQNIQRARQDPNDAYGLMAAISDSLKYVGQHAGSMWDTGEYFYEMEGSVGDFAVDALKEIFKGETGTKEGEAWFFNRGLNEKQQLAEGTYGMAGMRNLREIDEEMKAAGIDKDLRKVLIEQMVINASGTSGNVSDYVAQSLIDVGILTTPIENEAAGALSRATGNQLGVEATRINRGDMATQIPFVGNIIQAVRNTQGKGESKAPGGIMEWMDTYRTLARSKDVNTLTDADRFFGGIDKDGRIKEFARTDKTGLTDQLAESKVAGVGNIAATTMNVYMYDVKDTADIRNRLASMVGEASPETEYQTGMNNSADVLTVRDGLRYAINQVNPEIVLQQFDNSAGARETLARVASDLGMEIKDVLDLYSETPAVFEQRVRDYAAQHNGMFAGLDVSAGVDQISTIVKGFTTVKDGKGAPMAWNINQLQYQITTSMIDSMAEYYTDYYGVKPNSTINTVFDTLKSAQSLLLLGWSPSYFINNVINNAVTSASEGVLGFMSTRQIRQWMDAFGVTPARFDVDTNAEFRGQTTAGKGGLEAFTSAASEAKKAETGAINKGLREINSLLRKANDKLGAFSKLSGLMETLQGNQLTTVAIQQYWGRRWKRGEGFHLMPTELVYAIEAQTPGMTNVIYQAIENGLSMDQVGKALFSTYVKADAGTVMKQVCDNLFRGEPASVYEEILEKSGVTREIRERFENCKTDEERATVMDDVREKLNNYLENLRREKLIERANEVAAVAEAERLPAVAQIMSEMEMNHQDFWLRIRKEWSEVKQKIREDNMDGPEAQSIQADLVARHDKEWADLNKQEAITAAGIMQGLGFEHESHARYIGLMIENQKNWQDFNREKGLELKKYFERRDAIKQAAGKGKKADSVKINEAWEDYNIAVNALYDQHFAREQDIQGRMDQAFIDGYEFASGKSGEQLRQNFQRIRDIRQEMYEMQKEAHQKTKDLNRDDQAAFYEEFNPKYNAKIREIGNLGDANARIIDADQGHAYENHAAATMTPEETVFATETKDISDAQREQALREQQGYLDRDGIREGWIEAGRTPVEADLMMAVFDAAAESWAKQNGMYPDEFYSHAAQLKGITSWLPGTDGSALNQTAEEYAAKYHDIIMQHFGNPAFREWFGNSKVVDENHLPLVVHHGTKTQFDTFNQELLGTNTGAPSAEMGFFFAKAPETANKYAYGNIRNLENRVRKYSLNEIESLAAEYTPIYEEAMKIVRDKDMYDYEYLPSPEGLLNSIIWAQERLDAAISRQDKYAAYDWQEQLDYSKKELGAVCDICDILLERTKGDPHVMDIYLSMQNPLIYDYEGKRRSEAGVRYSELIAKAKAEGRDGVILKNTYDGAGLDTIYVVFDNTQIKSIENDGTFNKLDPNILHQQAIDSVKGTFEHTDVGNIIRMLNASDVSTMVHESGHLFRRTLNTQLMGEYTQWAGFENVGEFQELETRFWKNDPSLSEAERTRYEEAEEKFARGFEQYLMDGSAPTPGLKAVFKAFRDYLLDIYKKVKATVTGNDYSQQGEFVFHGKTGDEVLNIHAEINGVKLADIFDRMLTDDVQRMPGYQEIVQNYRTQLGQDRHNMRLSDKALSRRAQIEVTKQILQGFGGMDAAEAALQNYDLPLEINGWRVDDATLFEAIQAAKADDQMNPFAQASWHEVKGTNTYAHSNKGNERYQMQYKVVELNDLVPSNVWFGDQLVINEEYPGDVQARDRSADQSDVYAHAANLNPGKLIDEQRSIDRGAPIIGEGNMFVESGNGRVLSLQYAHDHFPDQWQNYQEYLRSSVGDYGIDPAQLDSFENPVLIRERLGGDPIVFAEDANTDTNKSMTASENALTDANRMNMNTLGNLDITPGEGVDTFDTEKNAQITVEWIRSLPESEQAAYRASNRNGDIVLSADGKTRFINALFATLYATPESMEIIRSFSETADSNIQAVESALKATLPEMARAEGLIRSGSRSAELSITADVMAAAGLLQDARKAGINIHDYLSQQTIPGLERWTPTQALLAGFFGDAKNNVRMLKDFFNAYGEEVYKAGDPNQMSFFGESKTREQMINDSLQEALNRRSREVTNPEGGIPKPAPAGEGPRLNQSVLDSSDRWSSEFAKVLDENLQRTFDDGMAVPLADAERVYLHGDVDTKYETRVQRWLRDFSNDKNLTADQYLYAWDYFEWWVQGSNGEAPAGNPVWESQIRDMVIKDFAGERGEMVSELQRRYRKGAEVDTTAVPNTGEYVKRTYQFEHGFWDIAGNVYKDGKLVAYLPEQLDRMQKTIEVDGRSYHVLGVDLQDPEGLVYYDPLLEITRTVIAGKPQGFDQPRNPFSFFGPAKQGSTPQAMPVADAYSELKTKYLDPALDAFAEAYKTADMDARTKQMSGLDLQTRAQLMQYLDDVGEDMRAEKYRAMKYSDMKKDAAMLNYNQRYGFDPILTMISPYQFWYTRSMWKWAKRMIDKPSLGNAYERMQEYEDKNRQENLPSRLSGRWRIAMPFLPEWMGGSYFVDLNSQLFPFSQFGESYSSNMNTATLNARTEEILSQMVQDGTIDAAAMTEAMNKKSGAVWENAYAQAELEIGRNDQLNTLASQFISPNIFATWYQKKQKGEDPGMLSGTRTGNAIRALTQDIPLVSSLGSVIGDAMSMPEKALRKLYGLDYNEFGQYGDQQIRKQISQMCADGEITWRQALNAMNEQSGTIWDMAADRQRKEAMMKVPGFTGAEAVKQMVSGNASVGDALAGLAIGTISGGAILPRGEQKLREQKAARDQAYIDKANGDTEAVNRWYDENPEYVTRTATYIEDPEELLKYTLFQNISTTYYAQPYAQQQEIRNQLGPEFYRALFNKETKNYKAVPIEKLAEWNAAIGGTNPAVGSVDVQGVQRVMQLSQPVINSVEEHDRIKAERFPGISQIQNIYYDLPKDQRKAFLAQAPQLQEYWDWNREYKNDHPDYVQWENERSAYYNEETLYNSYAEMTDYTKKQLEYAKATGSDLRESAAYELQRLYQRYANPNFLSFEDYIKQLQDWE